MKSIIAPLLFVNSITPSSTNLTDFVELVYAMISPRTSRGSDGSLVPIPTFPVFALIRTFSLTSAFPPGESTRSSAANVLKAQVGLASVASEHWTANAPVLDLTEKISTFVPSGS